MMRADQRQQLELAIEGVFRTSGGMLPRQSARGLAAASGVSETTVQRIARQLRARARARLANHTQVHAQPAPGDDAALSAAEDEPGITLPGQPWWATEDGRIAVLTALGGAPTMADAWRDLTENGTVSVTYPSFTRQLKQHLPPAVYAGLTAHGSKKGREAYLEASLYCTQITEGRNTRWQADVQYVPVRVRTQTAQEVAEVFQITFLDEATRRVMATMFTLHRPTGNDVTATLAAAVLGTTDETGNFYGGLPEAIMWDNGGEFLNESLGHACAVLGIIPIPAPPYSGWRKGKIERFHRTSQQRFYAKLPGAVHGPKTFKGSRPWQGNPNELLFFDSFMAKALNGVEEYNDVHVHSALGCTPNQAWLRDSTPIRRAPDTALHPLMLTLPKTRLVAKDGISYQNTKFVSPTLAGWRRRKVEIRVLPHDVESVFVFNPENGEFICRATPAAQLSATERHRLLRRRADDYAVIRNAIRAGTEQRNRQRLIDDVLAAEQDRRDRSDSTHPGADRVNAPNASTVDDIHHLHAPLGTDTDALLSIYEDN